MCRPYECTQIYFLVARGTYQILVNTNNLEIAMIILLEIPPIFIIYLRSNVGHAQTEKKRRRVTPFSPPNDTRPLTAFHLVPVCEISRISQVRESRSHRSSKAVHAVVQ